MTDHVPSLEMCQKLKVAGFPQETHFQWRNFFLGYEYEDLALPITRWDSRNILTVQERNDWLTSMAEEADRDRIKFCAAPLLTEILEQLPATHFENANLQLLKDKQNGYSAYYHAGRNLLFKRDPENAAEAAAQLWLALHGGDQKVDG